MQGQRWMTPRRASTVQRRKYRASAALHHRPLPHRAHQFHEMVRAFRQIVYFSILDLCALDAIAGCRLGGEISQMLQCSKLSLNFKIKNVASASS